MSHLNFFKNGCDSTVVAVRGANNRRKAVRAGGVSLENCWKGVPFSKNGAGATVVLFYCAFGRDSTFAEHAEHKDPQSYREVLIQRQSTWRCADCEALRGITGMSSYGQAAFRRLRRCGMLLHLVLSQSFAIFTLRNDSASTNELVGGGKPAVQLEHLITTTRTGHPSGIGAHGASERNSQG